jgi:hypothetical protein
LNDVTAPGAIDQVSRVGSWAREEFSKPKVGEALNHDCQTSYSTHESG